MSKNRNKKHFVGGEIPEEILNRIKENPGISYEKLLLKCRIMPPYKQRPSVIDLYLESFIEEKKVIINEKGEVNLCQ